MAKRKKIVEEETSAISVSEIKDDFVPEAQPVIVDKDDGFDMSSDEHRDLIVKLKDSVQHDYLEICKLLYQTQKLRRYESWGYGSFKDYAHQELGFKYARARQLADLGVLAYADPKHFQEITSVGIDKAHELKRVTTKENLDEWLDKAKQLSADDLKKHVRQYLNHLVPNNAEEAVAMEGQAREEVPQIARQLHSKSFNFTYDNLMAVSQAITMVKTANPDISSEAECLALICAEYLASGQHDGLNGEAFAIESIKRHEQMFGFKAIVAKKTTSGFDIVHGMNVAQDLIQDAVDGVIGG